MTEILHRELSDLVVKCAIEVQSELGTGFLEKVYENALVIALQNEGVVADQQVSLEVYFKGHLVGDYVADIVVDNRIILELKAVERLHRRHYAQVINYLKAGKMEVGYVINFGHKPLEFKRLADAKHTSRTS